MDIAKRLPPEIISKIFEYLSHPTADMIRDRVEELGLNKSLRIIVQNPNLEIELVFRDFFATEHFDALNHFRDFGSYDDFEFLDAERIMRGLMWDASE